MSKQSVERAIILAAGRGSRLAQDGDTLPKPLRPVAGVPLIVRILRTLATAGIREAVVVVGFQGDRIRAALTAPGLSLGLSVTFVDNPHWERSNGLSVLAAAPFIDRECLLSMSDHLVAPALVSRLLRADIPAGACALGVDYDIERCFDLDDATKVQVADQQIVSISKELLEYNAIDTGLFRINAALVESLRGEEARRGDASLSDGVRALAATGRFVAADVGDARWIDVDTPAAHARAEALVRVFGDGLDDGFDDGLDADAAPTPRIDPEAMEIFAPTWVRGAPSYKEDHFALADREEAEGRSLTRLMSNESPFAPSKHVVEAVMAVLHRSNRYPDALLTRELRTRLAAEVGLEEESCVLGAGSSEIIDLLVRTFVGPGEEVVLAVPTFSMYESRTRVCGGVPVLVPMRNDLELDVTALLERVTERTKLVFLCSPNNPTGRRIETAALARILRLGIPVAVDEAYVEFGDVAHSVAPLIAENANLIVLRTFSKAYGLAGMRVGYCLTAAAVSRLIHRVKLPWNVSSVALAAALAVLDDLETHNKNQKVFRSERQWLCDEIALLPNVEVFDSQGNFLLLDIHETGWSAEALVQAMLRDGVYIRALGSHHLRRGWVRISVGTPEDNRRCVAALRRALLRSRPRPPAPAAH
jgi:histidinol-phosphate aminotransferase